MADTPANDERFGRPGSGRGQGVDAFPQLRLVGLGECGTQAMIAVAHGPLKEGEQALATGVLGTLTRDMLCLADRGFYSWALSNQARASGADLLWRMPANVRLSVERRISDGSYQTTIYAAEQRRPQGPRDRVSDR